MSNEIQQYAVYILFHCSITLHVSGADRTHHQEYRSPNLATLE